MRDVHIALCRALVAHAGAAAAIRASRSSDWASANFVGQRHAVTLATDAATADRVAAEAAEWQFAIPRHLVADVAVASRSGAGDTILIELEVLTLEAH